MAAWIIIFYFFDNRGCLNWFTCITANFTGSVHPGMKGRGARDGPWPCQTYKKGKEKKIKEKASIACVFLAGGLLY